MEFELHCHTKYSEADSRLSVRCGLEEPADMVSHARRKGLAGIAIWINNYFDLKEDKKIDKKDDRIKKLKSWIDDEYERGRVTVISDVEMEQLVGDFLPDLLKLRESRVE